MSRVQSGILPEHCRAAVWLEASVQGDFSALSAGCKTFIDALNCFPGKIP
jgi:putative iron-dependent peroxidase